MSDHTPLPEPGYLAGRVAHYLGTGANPDHAAKLAGLDYEVEALRLREKLAAYHVAEADAVRTQAAENAAAESRARMGDHAYELAQLAREKIARAGASGALGLPAFTPGSASLL